MKLPITGHCLCKAISYEVNEPPMRTGFCYCRSCQRRSGAGHVGILSFAIEAVNIIGSVKWYSSTGDSGKQTPRGFCPECGTTMFGRPEHWPHILIVYVGSLSNASEFTPEINVWVNDRHVWDYMDEKLVTFDKNPG